LKRAFGCPPGFAGSLLGADQYRDQHGYTPPWRDPRAIAALGAPARAPVGPDTGKLGVGDVLFGGKVFYVSLATLAVIALLLGFTGGLIDRKTAEVAEAFTTSKVML
jgi:hypothetical protein